MVKKLLIISAIILAFQSNSQLLFKCKSPAAVAGNYEFTYSSDPNYSGPWGSQLSQAANLVEDTLMLVAEGKGSDSIGCLSSGKSLAGKIAFIYRGNCSFYDKARYAQAKGARAVVIVNNVDGDPIGMGGSGSVVKIPVVQISKKDGAKLKAQMANESVVVAIGNFQGYYNDNLSMYKDYALTARSYGIPELTAKDSSEVIIPLGVYVLNRGKNTIPEATVTVEIKKNNQLLYTETLPKKSINSQDTLVYQFNSYPVSKVSLGKYTITYFTNSGAITDLDHSDDTLRIDFEITDNIYSLVPLNNNGIPIATSHNRSATTGLMVFKQCVKYSNPNASRINIDGMYFSVDLDSSNESMNLEEFSIDAYKWNDKYNSKATPFALNFDSLEILNSTYFNILGNYQDTMLYFPLSDKLALENNINYLFCLTPTNPKVNIGYNSLIDYGLNNSYNKETIHPSLSATSNSETWYSGFVSNLVPAFGLKTSDLKANISTLSSSVEKFYPNPSNDYINLVMKYEGNAKLTVTDISGKAVLNSTVQLVNNTSKININSLESGVYNLSVILENGNTSNFRFIKN